MKLSQRELKRKWNKLVDEMLDAWYERILKKERPSKYIDSFEYVELIKDEVYQVWPKTELVELLASYGTRFGSVKLPKTLTNEQLCELSIMYQEMYKRYINATVRVMDRIRNLELDTDVVFQKKYIKKKKTRRQALMIDEFLEELERLKFEPIEIEMSEETKATLTVEDMEEQLNGMRFIMDISAIYFPSVILEAELNRALNKMQHLLANPPSRKQNDMLFSKNTQEDSQEDMP